MGADEAQIGFLDTFSVLLAHQIHVSSPVLAVVRNWLSIDVSRTRTEGTMHRNTAPFITKADSVSPPRKILLERPSASFDPMI